MPEATPLQVGPFAECPLCRHWIRLEEFEPAHDGGFVAVCAYCEDEVRLPAPAEFDEDED